MTTQRPRRNGERRPVRPVTFTSTPDVPAPALRCSICDRPLMYLQTVLGGVRPPERWDYYECRRCGFFDYRHRARKLRRIPELPFPPPKE
jgi:hypothetical protein